MKKPAKRFSYLEHTIEPVMEKEATSQGADMPPIEDGVRSVARGKGRMAQNRTQLNVRVPTVLKRRAAAKAVLEGRTLGDVLEAFLQDYVSDNR